MTSPKTHIALIILLCAGDKRKQAADIEKAAQLWIEYENRERRASRARR
jgi:putative component of toxin-antitoxin plasmid stabilization module